MTREQARREVDSIDFYLQHHTDDYSESSHTAMMMAISALEQQPCDDAVSRKDVINAIDKWITEYKPQHYLVQSIRELPSVTPSINADAIHAVGYREGHKEAKEKYSRRKGHWIEHEIEDTLRWLTCSECGREYINKKDNYCPRCGADMRNTQKNKGHWELCGRVLKCSNCGKLWDDMEDVCPNCGADMESAE